MISICKWGQKGIWILFPAWLRWMLTGDGWKERWPCGLAFKAVLRSRHLSSLPCVDVTTLLELERIHKDPCLTPNFILQQLFFSSFFFFFRFSSTWLYVTWKPFLSWLNSPWEWRDLHIHWALASDAHIARLSNAAISDWLRGKAATRLSYMQIQK